MESAFPFFFAFRGEKLGETFLFLTLSTPCSADRWSAFSLRRASRAWSAAARHGASDDSRASECFPRRAKPGAARHLARSGGSGRRGRRPLHERRKDDSFFQSVRGADTVILLFSVFRFHFYSGPFRLLPCRGSAADTSPRGGGKRGVRFSSGAGRGHEPVIFTGQRLSGCDTIT